MEQNVERVLHDEKIQRRAGHARAMMLAYSRGMTDALASAPPRLDPAKFRDPFVTAKGETRAQVALKSLDTLWFNTGTLCNLTCENCYIGSSPRNDRLANLTTSEVMEYLDEIERERLGTELIGFTGGEPFMNSSLPAMLEEGLSRRLRGAGPHQCHETDAQEEDCLA